MSTETKIVNHTELTQDPIKGYTGPRGEMRVRGMDGNLYDTFICHGCQSCWQMSEDMESVIDCGPHFYKLDKVEE